MSTKTMFYTSHYSASDRCIYIVQFQREEQNDAYVYKSILNEDSVQQIVEYVDRDQLCTNVDPNGMHVDLGNWLSMESQRTDRVHTTALMGNQGEVKKHLQGILPPSAFPDKDALGIYCVLVNTSSNASVLVFFAWLPTLYFQGSSLRDLPTYSLRFFTQLTSNIVCCCTVEELEEIKTLARNQSAAEDKSKTTKFSMSLTVEKKQDKEDQVGHHLAFQQKIDRPKGNSGTFLIDGKFLASASYEESTVSTYLQNENYTSFCHSLQDMRYQLKSWIDEQHEQYRVIIPSLSNLTKRKRNWYLKLADRWDTCTEKVQKMEASVDMKIELESACLPPGTQETLERLRETTETMAESFFTLDPSLGRTFFDEEVLNETMDQMKRLSVFPNASNSKKRKKNSLNLEEIVCLPMNLSQNFDILTGLYNNNCIEEVPAAFGQLLYSGTIRSALKNKAAKSGWVKAAWNYFKRRPSFIECVEPELDKLKKYWLAKMNELLNVSNDELKNRHAQQIHDQGSNVKKTKKQEILDGAYEALFSFLGAEDELKPLQLHIDKVECSTTYRLNIKFRRETVSKSNCKLHVSEIKLDQEVSSYGYSHSNVHDLGFISIEDRKAILGIYTFNNSKVLQIVASGNTTIVQFKSLQRSQWQRYRKQEKIIRRFPKRVQLCDYDAENRLLVFTSDSSLVLYRFNEDHTRLEPIDTVVNMETITTLELPLQSITCFGGDQTSILLQDGHGNLQAYFTRSKQMSKQLKLNGGGKNRIFRVASGAAFMVIPCCTSDSDATLASIRTFVTTDHHELPVMAVSSTSFQANGMMVHANHLAICGVDELTVHQLMIQMGSESFNIYSQEASATSDIKEEQCEENHWLWSFFHVFEKFPAKGLIHMDDDDDDSLYNPFMVTISTPCVETQQCLVQFMRLIDHKLQNLQKLGPRLDLAQHLSFSKSPMSKDQVELPLHFQKKVYQWIRELITFIPMQICRAESNRLLILSDGKMEDEFHTNEAAGINAADMAQNIRFGLLSSLLQAWTGQVVVVTSMGKQSTGKSYFLNHLTGSSFAIAGGRCTDGVWMTLRYLEHALLVVLDFEGLGSFERSMQEDVLLSVLNASVSMMTIFRMEMRFDKEMDDMFSKFQQSMDMLKGDERLFQGQLYLSVKDVNPNDQSEVYLEFQRKLRHLLAENRERNFVTELYSGKVKVNCSPPLGTLGYYQSLLGAKEQVCEMLVCGQAPHSNSESAVGFQGGRNFMDCLRLVLAKVSILDWTSMDESALIMQYREVQAQLPIVLRYGCILPSNWLEKQDTQWEDYRGLWKESLQYRSGEDVCVSLSDVCAVYPLLANQWKDALPHLDFSPQSDEQMDLVLNVGSSSLKSDEQQVMEKGALALALLFKQFILAMQRNPSQSVDRLALERSFDIFSSFILHRRKTRILSWIKDRVRKQLPEPHAAIERTMAIFQGALTRCQHVCSHCQLGCLLPFAHEKLNLNSQHDCQTKHTCTGLCSYCVTEGEFDETNDVMIAMCSKPAGHVGRCECTGKDHTCGQPCPLADSPNCGLTCVKKSGHLTSEGHACAVQRHVCPTPCSAPECTGRCILNCHDPHTVHKCMEVRCMMACEFPGCTHTCACLDHFHGNEKSGRVFAKENHVAFESKEQGHVFFNTHDIHFCDQVHPCRLECQVDGICQVDVQLKQSTKSYEGQRSQFSYTWQEMNGKRRMCCILLEPFMKQHVGPHRCVGNNNHCEEEEPEPEDANDAHYCDVRCPSCNYYCNLVYGHAGKHATNHGNMVNTHFVSLEQQADIDLGDRKYTAGENGAAEMCQMFCAKMGRGHVHFYPCAQESAKNCVYDGQHDQRRHCSKQLDPPPPTPMDEILHAEYWNVVGWQDPCHSLADRELFEKCPYQCDAPEHLEANEVSCCMLPAWHAPVSTLEANNDQISSIVAGHAFGCAHVATSGKFHHIFVLDSSGSMSGSAWRNLMAGVNEYVENRRSSRVRPCEDLCSVITFNNSPAQNWEAQLIRSIDTSQISYLGGGTSFGPALRLANEILSRNDHQVYTPVLLFFSDGHPHDESEGVSMAKHIGENFAKYELKSFAVGYGGIQHRVLSKIADELGGSFVQVLTGSELEHTFYSISASIGTTTGLVVTPFALDEGSTVSCTICHLSLDTNVTQLECRHEFHAACVASLTTCPLCRAPIVKNVY